MAKTYKIWSKVILLIVTLATLFVFFISFYIFLPEFKLFIDLAWEVFVSGNKERIANWVDQFGVWGPVILIFSMVVQMFLFVISLFGLMLISIIAYGPILGSIIILIGISLSATVGYFIGFYFGEATVKRLLGQKTNEKIHTKVEKYGVWAVIFFRLSPFLSDDAISFIAGVLKMNYLKFLCSTVIGILPLTLLIVYLVEDYDRLKSGLIWLSVVSGLMLILYVFYEWWISKQNK